MTRDDNTAVLEPELIDSPAVGADRRLPPQPGECINRDKRIVFRFEGKQYSGYDGDTIASALAAAGQFVLSRSFKYHRARGVLTMAGQDANTLVQIPGNPNALADRVGIKANLEVVAVNVSGSLMRDRRKGFGLLSRFLPVGFYYKAFFRPKGAWEYWAKLFRRMTGLGKLDIDYRGPRYDKQYRFCDVLVVGAGAAGMAAAREAADAGLGVMLVDEQARIGGALHYMREGVSRDAQTTVLEELRTAVEVSDKIEVVSGAVCNGWFADNWLPIIHQRRLLKVRAKHVILATGALEQPAIFRNNDLPGIMMSSAVQRLIRLYAIKPGHAALVLTSNNDGYAAALDLLDAHVCVVKVVDTRSSVPDSELVRRLTERGVSIEHGAMIYEAFGNRNMTHVRGVEIRQMNKQGVVAEHGQHYTVDLVCMAIGCIPTYQLACQAGATLNYDDDTAVFSLNGQPESMHLAGAVNGIWDFSKSVLDGQRAARAVVRQLTAQPIEVDDVCDDTPSPNAHWPIVAHPKGKEFVDADEDLQINDLINATLDGYKDIQLVKRYSTCGMGPSQGRQSALAAARIVAKATNKSVAATGVTTARPPFSAEFIGVSAGRSFYPLRLTSMHACHIGAGATMMQAGAWERPAFYAAESERDCAIRSEVKAVRERVGLIDVSTLGGLEIRGKDAAEFINRIYTWGFAAQPVGRARYALMTNEAGVVIDDGVACRMHADHYYVTATTSGVDRVYRDMLKWNAQWRLEVDIANVTSAYGAVNLAGPRARDVLQKICHDVDLGVDEFGYMEVRQGHVADIPARVLRVGFVGELGYEIHIPQSNGEALWNALCEAGAEFEIAPFGVEAQRVMRLEKGHIIIGQDTDAMSNPLEVQMAWAVSKKKPFFVGERSLAELKTRGIKRKLVGFQLASDVPAQPKENHLIVWQDAMIGRVTSCAISPTLERGIGLAYVPYDYQCKELCIKCDGGQRITGHIVDTPFYDASNARQTI